MPDEILEQLAGVLRRAEQASSVAAARDLPPIVSSGCGAIDRLLPAGGLPRGALVEWLAAPAGGAGVLALRAARQAAMGEAGSKGRAIVVVERHREQGPRRQKGQSAAMSPRFYPPTAAAWGIDLSRLVLVRVASQSDEMWALDQVARCDAVAAWLWWGEQLEGRHFRRLQLAAETSGSLGLLVRPLEMQSQPSWAEVRFVVESQGEDPAAAEVKRMGQLERGGQHESMGRRVSVRLLRARRGGSQGIVNLEIDDATHTLCETKCSSMVAPLAHSTAVSRQAGA